MHLNPFFYEKLVRPKFLTSALKKTVEKEFILDNKSVLDFGCGTGSNAKLFDPTKYLGFDVDSGRIALAKKLYPGYKFKVLKTDSLSSEKKQFDIIFISATIHHISDSLFKKYLKDFKKVLKPKGRIIIIEPVFCKETRFNNWIMTLFDDGKYIRYEKQYLDLFGKDFSVVVHKRFKKCIVYNEIFFSASKKEP
ncbi:MAG: class I SAM-dependent methyltransferase [Candidatus ainarchaeum sp.]|nr:class I SAM-dependent methyltransferase [Candidatus ainarchaeum sp.]